LGQVSTEHYSTIWYVLSSRAESLQMCSTIDSYYL
jgi:hypothetical protein